MRKIICILEAHMQQTMHPPNNKIGKSGSKSRLSFTEDKMKKMISYNNSLTAFILNFKYFRINIPIVTKCLKL